MYIYNLCQFEPCMLDLFLAHEKEFTQEEFTKMCEEIKIKYKHSHIIVICNHLKEKYGFVSIEDYTIGYYEYNPIKGEVK